jgi:hypothetical protein
LLFCNFSLFAQDGFTLSWDSEVGCLTFDENREKEIPLEDIEGGECIKVCEDSEVMFELIFDEETQDIENISWSIEGGNIDVFL